MAQQFYIDNGTNINAGWAAHIAVSSDGINWTPISKQGLDVLPVLRTVSTNPSNPLATKEKRCIIELKRGGDDRAIASFDVDNVANQAGWTAGATVLSRCIAAVNDITSWLGVIGFSGSTPSVTRTASYDIVSVVGAGSIAAGAREISIKNNGLVPVTIDGDLLPVGESIGWDAGGQSDTLGTISYDIPATGSIQILKVV
jgi:hypothetical protein